MTEEADANLKTYELIATVSQNIKWAIMNSPGFSGFEPIKREALEAIATNIALLLNGQEQDEEKQRWENISELSGLISEYAGKKESDTEAPADELR